MDKQVDFFEDLILTYQGGELFVRGESQEKGRRIKAYTAVKENSNLVVRNKNRKIALDTEAIQSVNIRRYPLLYTGEICTGTEQLFFTLLI